MELYFHSLARWVKNPPVVQETQEMRVQSLGQEYPLEKEMATHSSTLAWEIPWPQELGRLQAMGSQVRYEWATKQQQSFIALIFKRLTALELPGTGWFWGSFPHLQNQLLIGMWVYKLPPRLKLAEALVKTKCSVFSSLSIVMGVDLSLVRSQLLCFQAVWFQAMKVLLWYKRLQLTAHAIQLCRDCNGKYHSKQSASRFCAQTQTVLDPTKAAASQSPPQLCSLPLSYPWKWE